jgi:uncharacterized membrane protein
VIAFELPKRENDVSTTKMSVSKHLRATVVSGFLDPRKKKRFSAQLPTCRQMCPFARKDTACP